MLVGWFLFGFLGLKDPCCTKSASASFKKKHLRFWRKPKHGPKVGPYCTTYGVIRYNHSMAEKRRGLTGVAENPKPLIHVLPRIHQSGRPAGDCRMQIKVLHLSHCWIVTWSCAIVFFFVYFLRNRKHGVSQERKISVCWIVEGYAIHKLVCLDDLLLDRWNFTDPTTAFVSLQLS